MKNKTLKMSCLIAALYFGGDAYAQQTPNDTLPKEQKIEEVVMIGYGSRKKTDNTTAISSINAEEVSKTKVLNANQAIQGKAAGVTVVASDLPGSTPTVIIRGLGTVLSGRQPLYVVDGIFMENINNINSNDILTYDILKDASALAIYGNRAANGVIIITTKSGRGKGITVEYDGFAGIRMPLQKVKMAGSNLYSYYSNLALEKTTFSQDQPINTDWFKTITRTGTYNQHNVSLSGSSEGAKYFLSLGNYDEKSILKGTDYNRTTVRTNNEFKISKKITLAQTFSVAIAHITPKPLSAFTTAYKQSPIVPVYFPDGSYGAPLVGANGFAMQNGISQFNNVGNPLAQINWNNERQKTLQLQGGLKLDAEIIKDLKFTSQYSVNYYNFKSYNVTDANNYLINPPTDNFGIRVVNTKEDSFNWSLTNYLNYLKKFGDNQEIDFTIGTEVVVEDGINRTSFTRENMLPVSNYWDLDGTNYLDNLTEIQSINRQERKLLSYFARAQYKLMNRYLLTATVRRDGSSQFADGYKWGTFPSFGVGWIVSEESFLKGNTFVNLLKLRAGWGRLGNQNIPLNYLPFSSGDQYNYAYDGTVIYPGITINKAYDPNLGWEVTEELSGGFDFELLNKRLKGSFDLYNKKTTNIILATTPVNTAGLNIAGYSHLGEVSNKGIEVNLGWSDKINEKIGYYINGNFSTNKNEILSLKDNVNVINGGSLGNGQTTKYFDESTVGQAIGSFYLWEVSGIDGNGNFTYVDHDGDGVTGRNDADDRKYFGSYIPKSTLGINAGFNYKSFDFTVNAYGAFGGKVYNGKKAQRFSNENIEYDVASNFWMTNNTGASNPYPFNDVPIASTYYLESGDFFRINNITLGYNLVKPAEYISLIRLYFSAINPFISQKFSGFSPELTGNGNPYELAGIELDAYPTVRSFVLGLNLKF